MSDSDSSTTTVDESYDTLHRRERDVQRRRQARRRLHTDRRTAMRRQQEEEREEQGAATLAARSDVATGDPSTLGRAARHDPGNWARRAEP